MHLKFIEHIDDLDVSNVPIGKNHAKVIDFSTQSNKRNFNIDFNTFRYYNETFLGKLFIYSNINSFNYSIFLYFKYLQLLIEEYKNYKLDIKNFDKFKLKDIKESLTMLEYFLINHFDNILNISDDTGTMLDNSISFYMNGLTFPPSEDFDDMYPVEFEIKNIFKKCFKFRIEELFRTIGKISQEFQIITNNYWPVTIDLSPYIDIRFEDQFLIIKLNYLFTYYGQLNDFLNLV